jgi:hypothetical protein
MRRPAALALALLFATAAGAQAPAPAEFLGFEPGTDRKLADYDQVYAYFTKLAATTDRVRFSSIGRTTENRDLGLAIISSAKNLAELEEIRRTNVALVDPRKLKPGEADALVARGKTIVCLNASIHSTEVGPTQATLGLAHFLATTKDPEWTKVLDDVVLLMLPCHNPDGYQKIVAWYRAWVGTPHEGCAFPGLYQTYAGHDNNRDWFMFNLQETKLTVRQVYQPWAPHIVIDMHQMGADGPRMFVPPYQDPIEPNVDPLLIERLNELGVFVQKELLAKGLKGIVTKSIFDAWSPSRAYMHYHGGVRFLCEVASCRVATPIERKDLAQKAESRTAFNPEPWSGDRWTLGDVVHYHGEAALAVLRHASSNRERWLKNFHEVFRRACTSSEAPAAFEIPLADSKRTAIMQLLEVLDRGGLEAQYSKDDQTVVIPRAQPFFSFARALLQVVPYPEIRESASRPIRKPYDATAHALPLLFNVTVVPGAGQRTDLLPLDSPRAALSPLAGASPKDELPPPGGILRTPGAPPIRSSDVLVYRPFITNVMDEGWTRFVLDRFRVPYTSISNHDVVARAESRPGASPGGAPRVLILPSMTSDQLVNGVNGADVPPDFRGGLGDKGVAWIDRFVREGGTLITLKDASALPIQIFKLPIRNALTRPPEGKRIDIPGSILKLEVDGETVPAYFDTGKAFEPDDAPDRDNTLKPVIKAKWAADGTALAGFAEGADFLAGKGAIVECQIGKGRVVLFAFSPQFRGQTLGTFKLFLDAIAGGLTG